MKRSVQGIGLRAMLRRQRVVVEGLERRVLLSASDLDPTFNGGGQKIIDFAGRDDFGGLVVVQANNKIVLGGSVFNGKNFDFGMVRLNVNGSIDTSFGPDGTGKVTLDIAGDDFSHALIQQSDGMLVMAGTSVTADGGQDYSIARFSADGIVDPFFNRRSVGNFSLFGSNTTNFSGTDTGTGLVQQTNGKLVMAGWTGAGDAGLVRYNTNGTVDTSFGQLGGKSVAPLGGHDQIYGLAIQGDGELLTVGGSDSGGTLARFSSSGFLDGVVLDNFATGRAIAVAPDGSIRVVGSEPPEGSLFDIPEISSFLPNGSDIDKLHVPISNDEYFTNPYAIALQRNGQIIVAGFDTKSVDPNSAPPSWSKMGVASLTGFNGINFAKSIDFANGAEINSGAYGVAVGPDGKIVVAGFTDAGGGGANFAVARLLGTPTGSFATISGSVFTDTDGDGVHDSNETGAVDARVYIDSISNNVYDAPIHDPFMPAGGEQSVLTDSSGNYKLDGLAAGTYKIRVVLPSNTFSQTLPAANGSYTVTVTAGQNATGKNFGIKPPKTNSLTTRISGSVFNDLNGNGVRNIASPVEPDLVGWKVYLDKNKNGKLDSSEVSTVTDSGGNYLFDHLAAGSYRVRLVVHAGYRQTTPANGYLDLKIKNGQQLTNEKFGVTKNILISGSVSTTVGSGDAKITEGLPGWTVYIDTDNNGVLGPKETSVLTDSSGDWSFTTLAASSTPYLVKVIPMAKWVGFTPVISVTLNKPGLSKTGLGFAEKKMA